MNETSHDPTHVFGRFDSGGGYIAQVSPSRTTKSKVGGKRFPRNCNECQETISELDTRKDSPGRIFRSK
ncbi:unnamed protein product [Allacma fusca]|uniref:Uncharacterized protein n=1 Tax=Allacma fusca TaxID=39272 RepID=A0A8J2KMG0_9HEXA|nr:unnamed protein product [Allacma fusca]